LPPDDIGGLYAGVMHMRGNDGKVVGFEGNQFELARHRQHTRSLARILFTKPVSTFAEYALRFNR
jgi:hypothetical protein